MRQALRITRQPTLGGELVAVSFSYPDRYRAQRALIGIEDAVYVPGAVELVDPPAVPEEGRFRLWQFVIAGILLGLAAAHLRWRLPFAPQLRPA
jgi:hypothetical protein